METINQTQKHQLPKTLNIQLILGANNGNNVTNPIMIPLTHN